MSLKKDLKKQELKHIEDYKFQISCSRMHIGNARKRIKALDNFDFNNAKYMVLIEKVSGLVEDPLYKGRRIKRTISGGFTVDHTGTLEDAVLKADRCIGEYNGEDIRGTYKVFVWINKAGVPVPPEHWEKYSKRLEKKSNTIKQS